MSDYRFLRFRLTGNAGWSYLDAALLQPVDDHQDVGPAARRVGGHALVGLREVYVDEDDDRGLTATVVRFMEPDCMS